MRTIIEVIKTPIRVETKVSAPKMSAAPIEAKKMTNQDMTSVSGRVTGLGQTKISRTAAIFLVSLPAALLSVSPLASQSPDTSRPEHADHRVQGGGTLPTGWSARPDADGDLKNVKFVLMEPGYHLTLGPATILYRQRDRAEGPFHTLATFHQMKKLEHSEGYGLFAGGQDLTGKDQRYTYFLVRDDGKYLVKRREGEKTTEVTRGWIAHPAIRKGDAQGKATNLLEIDAKQDPRKVEFKVNDQTVYTGDAKSLSLKGIVGLRVNHNLDLHVEGFDVHQ